LLRNFHKEVCPIKCINLSCCEFGLKVTPINFDVWSKRKVVINIKVTSSNDNNNKPRSNLGTKCKTQNHNQNIKREEKQGRTYTSLNICILHFCEGNQISKGCMTSVAISLTNAIKLFVSQYLSL